jgi:putative ABC transport system permease protein
VRVGQLVRLAWRSIRGHWGRSALTALGVVISVATIVALVTLGAGVQAGLAGDIAGDASTINAWAGPSGGAENPGGNAAPVFTDEDVEAIEEIEGVRRVGTRGYASVQQLTIGESTIDHQQVVAVRSAYFSPDEFERGEPFEDGAQEVVLNPAAAKRFEGGVDVGDTVELEKPDGTRTGTVVGILEDSQAQDPFDGLGEKPRVYVPTDPYYDRTAEGAGEDGQQVYPVLFVVAESADATSTVSDRVEEYLATESEASELLPADYEFSTRTNDEFLDVLLELLETVGAFILGIAVISLVIGGIGIANTMLVSVIQRTHEIGIMKAVGAKRRDVLFVFFVESILLSTVGSLVGLLAGVGTAYVGSRAIEVPFVIPWQWLAVALAVGMGVGGLAGLYPAWRAATTEPISALHAE